MTKFEILQEDCLAGLESRKDNIDLFVTSPPYNLDIKYGHYRDNLPRERYLAWLYDVMIAIYDRMAPDGSFFLNVGAAPSDPLLPFEIVPMALRMFKLQNTFHWIKSITVEDDSHGHFKPINSKRFVNDCHEYVFHFTKTGTVELNRLAVGVPYKDQSNIKRWASKNPVRCRGNNWYIPYTTIQSRDSQRPHPATFPTELPAMCMRLHGVEKITRACDPFLGIGSSAIAAKTLGIPHFIGYEIDPDYHAQSLLQIEK